MRNWRRTLPPHLPGIARKEEIAKLAHGEDFDLFDRDATAFFDEGTKENPIVILSNEPTRIVGCSLEVSALVDQHFPSFRWMTVGPMRPL